MFLANCEWRITARYSQMFSLLSYQDLRRSFIVETVTTDCISTFTNFFSFAIKTELKSRINDVKNRCFKKILRSTADGHWNLNRKNHKKLESNEFRVVRLFDQTFSRNRFNMVWNTARTEVICSFRSYTIPMINEGCLAFSRHHHQDDMWKAEKIIEKNNEKHCN